MGEDFGLEERWRLYKSGQMSPEEADRFREFLRTNRDLLDDEARAYLDSLPAEQAAAPPPPALSDLTPVVPTAGVPGDTVTFQPPQSGQEVTISVSDDPAGAGASDVTMQTSPVAPPAPAPAEPPVPDEAPADAGPAIVTPDDLPSEEGVAAGVLGTPEARPATAAWTPPARGSWWSSFNSLYDRMGTFGCALGVVFVLALLVLGVFETYTHVFGGPTAVTNNTTGTSSMSVGSPILGTQTYIEEIAGQRFSRPEVVSLQGSILSVDSQAGTGSTGIASCLDFRKDFSSTAVQRTEQIVRPCSGSGFSSTTSCSPAFPLYRSSLQVNVPQSFSSTCTTPVTSPKGSSTESFTDSGTITLTRTLTVAGWRCVELSRRYTRMVDSPGALPIQFTETSVYRIDHWQEVGTSTTGTVTGSNGVSSTTSSRFYLQGAPPSLLALLPAPVSSGGATSGGTNPGASLIRVSFNELGFQTPQSICQAGGTVQLGITLDGIGAGTPVVVVVDGPGLSRSISYNAYPGVKYTQYLPVPKGGGTYSDTIVSIGGKPPPSEASHVTGSVQC